MPSYTWGHDDHEWTVDAYPSRSSDPQDCPKCGKPGEKRMWRDLPNIDKTAAGSWNQASFNPGLGCWTHSTKHAEQIAKRRGLEPVGNEPVENLHKKAEKDREETKARRWADDRVLLYE